MTDKYIGTIIIFVIYLYAREVVHWARLIKYFKGKSQMSTA